MGIQDLSDVGVGQISVGHDAPDLGLAAARRAFIGRSSHKLGFSYRAKMVWPVGSISGPALDEHRCNHLVPGTGVLMQGVKPVGERSARRPKMMMRINDALVGVDDLLVDLV